MTYQQFSKSKYAEGLTDDQMGFFEVFLSGSRDIFLAGSAGTGKSYVTKRLSEFCQDNDILMNKTASTGVAAVTIGAQTLHSFLGMGIGQDNGEILFKKVKKNKRALERIRHCKILLVDEISMISGELLNRVYSIFEHFNRKQPRYIFVGDWLQLSPVFREDKLFAFESESWNKINPTTVILTEIVRQDKESEFAKFLAKIRVGDKSSLEFLESRMIDEKDIPEGAMVAFSKNIDVEQYNEEKLKLLPGPQQVYYAEDTGHEPFLSSLRKNCLVPEILKLRVNAQVMLLKNYADTEFVNGSIGKVIKMSPKGVTVKFDAGELYLEKEDWKIEENYLDFNGKVKTKTLAMREQIPIKLSFSSSIHKIQGITCDKIAVDLSNCFSDGQTYVALSRARTIDGLWVIGFSHRSVKTNKKCLEFYQQYEAD